LMNVSIQFEPNRAWNFNGSAKNEAVLKPLCQRAEKLFELPARRLCRYFAVWDDPCLARDIGPYYRGFHFAFDREKIKVLPSYLSDCFFIPQDELGKHDPNCPFEELVAFDDLIYFRPSTCLEPTGCVVTHAHELQHVVQTDHYPNLMKVNSVLRQNLKRFKPTATEIDLPAERDANIVSKRVAEIVCGAEAVRTFAKKEIRRMEEVGAAEKKVRWEFFRDVTSCDLLDETLSLVEEHKAHLDFGVDVDKPEWWLAHD
jgi:hypothetical protein